MEFSISLHNIDKISFISEKIFFFCWHNFDQFWCNFDICWHTYKMYFVLSDWNMFKLTWSDRFWPNNKYSLSLTLFQGFSGGNLLKSVMRQCVTWKKLQFSYCHKISFTTFKVLSKYKRKRSGPISQTSMLPII